ncbi:hypothetical protein HMPREF9104_01494 [Lentilactobacillus kisonensis F0435]|uniref:Uncharacterized protein n=1 Tax=Lentilactobacillus kisonensis F0435 TaxID=797516 RepID=H1LFW8_9LACO|nr:hypothetical protein HMPREF9104_01494 [Lentilactobacillus kisonensis F0435]
MSCDELVDLTVAKGLQRFFTFFRFMMFLNSENYNTFSKRFR